MSNFNTIRMSMNFSFIKFSSMYKCFTLIRLVPFSRYSFTRCQPFFIGWFTHFEILSEFRILIFGTIKLSTQTLHIQKFTFTTTPCMTWLKRFLLLTDSQVIAGGLSYRGPHIMRGSENFRPAIFSVWCIISSTRALYNSYYVIKTSTEIVVLSAAAAAGVYYKGSRYDSCCFFVKTPNFDLFFIIQNNKYKKFCSFLRSLFEEFKMPTAWKFYHASIYIHKATTLWNPPCAVHIFVFLCAVCSRQVYQKVLFEKSRFFRENTTLL